MSDALDLSIILPTFNRSEILRKTLEAFTRVNRDGLAARFCVVDNNSKDDTRQVVESFQDRLPLMYLFEGTPGKNAALNRGIEDGPRGDIVVFCDDDITPCDSWLHDIRAACERHSEFDVFGGRIEPFWPYENLPAWAADPGVQSFAFAVHRYAQTDTEYAADKYPFGPNFWVRRCVLDSGLRFCERLGPHPTNRIIGDETEFLKRVRDAGHRMLFTPTAAVEHRIQPENISLPALRKRAFSLGRGRLYLKGVSMRGLLDKRPWLWKLVRHAALLRHRVRHLFIRLSFSEMQRVRGSFRCLRDIGYHYEALRVVADGYDPDQPAAGSVTEQAAAAKPPVASA